MKRNPPSDARGFNRIFKPRRIALIGVTLSPRSVGGKILSNLVSGGFRGVVYPANPALEAVMDIPCYPDVRGLPKTPGLAVIRAAAARPSALSCRFMPSLTCPGRRFMLPSGEDAEHKS